MLMFDFDYKKNKEGYETYKDIVEEISDFIICIINDVLTKIFKNPDISFARLLGWLHCL